MHESDGAGVVKSLPNIVASYQHYTTLPALHNALASLFFVRHWCEVGGSRLFACSTMQAARCI
jgi:hypothetical protein